jgi:hypothetical protein
VKARAQTPDAQTLSTPAIERSIFVRSYQVIQDRKLRIFAVVDEADGNGKYLLNTLDAKSFRLTNDGTQDKPLEPLSLSTFSTQTPPSPRGTAVVFEANQSFSAQQLNSIRSGVASFMGGFRSELLTIHASTNDKSVRVAWNAPGQSENPRAIQKSILETEPMVGLGGVRAGICAAYEELKGIDEQFPGSQKNIIFVSRPANEGHSGWSQTRRCIINASEDGFRVFWVRLRESAQELGKFDAAIESVVEKSGGFVSKLRTNSDPVAALNNIRSYLDDEYVLEFDAAEHRPHEESFEAFLTVSYHGNIYRSTGMKFSGLAALPHPDELVQEEERLRRAAEKERESIYFLGAVIVFSGLFVVFILKRKSVGCAKCGFRVSSTFQDCPFRGQKCFGRLSVVQGPALGMGFPLFSGENSFGTSNSNTIRWADKKLSRKHGKIIITKRKALFVPAKGAETRVNGMIATEPRLLCSGTVLRMGDSVCKVDFKEGA